MWFRRSLLGRSQKSEEEVKQTGAQHVSEVLNKMNFGLNSLEWHWRRWPSRFHGRGAGVRSGRTSHSGRPLPVQKRGCLPVGKERPLLPVLPSSSGREATRMRPTRSGEFL